MSEQVIFYDWPGGMKSVAGGTRTSIKLDRPWQKEILVDPEKCPFCTKPQKDIQFFDQAGGWRLIENAFTPYPYHRMVIPNQCWSPEEQRMLGGPERIAAALGIICQEVLANKEKTLFVNVHVGSLAGQNVGHLHYHIVQYKFDDDSESKVGAWFRDFFVSRKDLVVYDNSMVVAGLGGIRAGQLFIVPTGIREYEQDYLSDRLPGFLFYLLSDVVRLYNEKFKSAQGLPPDFKISLMFQNGKFKHGVYVPILNHLGSSEEMALYEESCPITLPWSHETTAEYLKS